MRAGKSLDCCEQTFKRDCGESSQRREKSCRESFHLLREYLTNHEQNVGKNVDGNDVSAGNEEKCYCKMDKRYSLYLKCQRTWLNCVYVLVSVEDEICERFNCILS